MANEKFTQIRMPDGSLYDLGGDGGIDVEAVDDTLKFTGGSNASEVKLSTTGSTIEAIRFGKDENGNYGYYKVGADTLTPFNASETKVGTFTSGSTRDSLITIELGFKPDFILVQFKITDKETDPCTNAFYIKAVADITHYSYWDLSPIEGSFYRNTLGSSGETGIYNIVDTTFIWKAHGDNTLNKECSYVACKF